MAEGYLTRAGVLAHFVAFHGRTPVDGADLEQAHAEMHRYGIWSSAHGHPDLNFEMAVRETTWQKRHPKIKKVNYKGIADLMGLPPSSADAHPQDRPMQHNKGAHHHDGKDGKDKHKDDGKEEPRLPKGKHGGGQWTKDGGGPAQTAHPHHVHPNAPHKPIVAAKPGSVTKIKIVHGDTLSELALKHGTTVKHLMDLNPKIKNPNLIYAGDTLYVSKPPPLHKPDAHKPDAHKPDTHPLTHPLARPGVPNPDVKTGVVKPAPIVPRQHATITQLLRERNIPPQEMKGALKGLGTMSEADAVALITKLRKFPLRKQPRRGPPGTWH